MFSLPQNVQSIGEILDSGIKLFITEFKNIILLSFIAYFLITIVIIVIPFEDPEVGVLALGLCSIFIVVVVYILIYSVIAMRLWGAMHSNTPSTGVAFRHVLSCFPGLFAGAVLYSLALISGFILLIIPAVIFGLLLFFYSYCILFEGDSAVTSLKHSHKLVWGNWWRSAVILTVPLVIKIAFSFMLVLVVWFQGLEVLDESGVSTIWFDIVGSIIIETITVPIFTCVSLVLFYDLKLRREGSDLQQRIESME